ncbi:mitochondrial fission ELM1-domain-containing protein [Sporodiniella umbellata]|nr:mitochondrial fission ELM1-domain-containing protein [Sporodiniella umbellata]
MLKNVLSVKTSVRHLSTKRSVWVVTDGGIESTLQAMALGKRLSGSNSICGNLKLKTIVASKKLQMFPTIIQKYIVDYSASKNSVSTDPWYLSFSEGSTKESSYPDYVVSSGLNAVPACIHISKAAKSCFSVYLGYPNIPFVNFSQVILPKYEANAKMAALGPLAKQKNGIITPAPLLDTSFQKTDISNPFFKGKFSAVIVGGHSPDCRWYSEDAVTLADNVKRMIHTLNDNVTIVYTDRTPELVKEKIKKRLEGETAVQIWDSTQEKDTLEKISLYENIVTRSERVILTADLDYATAHAISKNKPVYLAFGGSSRSYLLHFYRWMLDNNLARKLRLDRGAYKSKQVQDPYSYLGQHAPWGNPNRLFQTENTMSFVESEVNALREESITGKRKQIKGQ